MGSEIRFLLVSIVYWVIIGIVTLAAEVPINVYIGNLLSGLFYGVIVMLLIDMKEW